MKCLLLYSALFLVLIAASCKKSDSDSSGAKSRTWKLGTTTYTVHNYAKSSNDFQAFDSSGNELLFSFGTYPTADGTYNVVSNTATLGAHDVSIVASMFGSGPSYFSTGNDHTTATIKMQGSVFLRVSLPDTWVMKGGTDSLKLSADLGDL